MVLTVLILIYQDKVKDLESYGYLGVFFLGILTHATVIVPGPTVGAAVAMGTVFNPYLVGLLLGFGAAFGELTGYLAGVAGGEIITHQTHAKKLYPKIEKWGALAIFVLALLPNPLFDVGGFIAGSLRIPIFRFMFATAVGKTIRFGLVAALSKKMLG